METSNNSLSSGGQLLVGQNTELSNSSPLKEIVLSKSYNPLAELASFRQPDTKSNSPIVEKEEEYEDDIYQLLAPNPLIQADREQASITIQHILSSIELLKKELYVPIFEGPICPYQRTLLEYLGPSYVCPTIYELPVPLRFSSIQANNTIVEINEKYNKQMMTHLQLMTAEAANMGFAGITSQNLNNAFSVLSATESGQEYIIDKLKTSKHLEFAEIVRNIPTDYVMENPLMVAQKLLGRYIEINQG